MLPPTALIPVRTGPTAKRRLAHVLSPAQRAELVRGMLEHVATVLLDAGLRVIVLSPEGAEVGGAEARSDEGAGLNAAVAAAIDGIGAPILVVHADLPLLSDADVSSVLEEPSEVVVARSYDGGTNGLLLRRPVRPAFGAGSAFMHAERARRAGMSASVLDLAGFALDVDDENGLSACANAAAFRYTRP